MAPRHPPRFVVRTLDDVARARARWVVLVAAWVLSLVAATTAGHWFARHGSAEAFPPAEATSPLSADNEVLRQKVTELESASRVNDVATQQLKQDISQRDEEIAALRTDLAVHAQLMGGPRHALRIQRARSVPIKDSPGAWNVAVVLTRGGRHGSPVKGSLRLAVEGLQDGKVLTLEGTGLGRGEHRDMPFSFLFYQQVQGSFTLPAGFQPTRLRLAATAQDGGSAQAAIPWTDATRHEETHDVQQ